jgi:hypothetical protein
MTGTSTRTAPPRDFRLLLPAGWLGLDLEPANTEDGVEPLVAQAAAAGAFRAWFFSDVIEGRGLSASLTATVVTADVPSERVERRQRRVAAPAPVGGGRTVESVLVQFLVPIPASRSVLLLSFATPNVGLEDAFVTLFDSIVATLRWTSS